MAKKPSYEELQQRVQELEASKIEQSTQHDILNNLFNVSLDMLCVVSLDGHFRFVNSAFVNTLGHTRETFLETPFIEFVHPDDKLATQAASAITTREPVTYFENRYRCKHGSYRWLAWTAVPATDETLIYAVARDITKQKTTQIELAAERDLLKNILSLVPASVFWKDRNSVYLGVNEQFARDAGVQSPDELIGKSDYDLAWTKEEADFYRQCDRKVMDSGEPMLNIEESQQQADGKEINLLTNKVPLLDALGQVYGMLGIYMDITERKRATTALAISEQRFRTIFNSSYQLIGVLDPDGISLDVNQTTLDAVGLEQEDIVGRPFWDIYCWSYSTDVQSRLKAAIRDAAEGKPVRYEEELLTAGNTIRIIDFTLKPVVDEQGETVLIIPEGRDITDIKRAKEEIQRHHQEIAHVIRLSTAGEMASGMAHELNQPLTALVSYCGTALSLLNSLPEPQQQLREILECASEQAHRAGGIIRHLRDFVRKDDNSWKSIELDQLIKDLNFLLSSELDNAAIKLEYHLQGQGCHIMVNKVQIEQVLINLVRNSVEAMQAAKTIDGKVIVETRKLTDASIKVTVADNGPGIAADIMDTMFNPFQTSKASGMGMGLSISRSIIEAHGGSLWMDKDYQNGALFGFDLPVSKWGYR